MTRTRRRRPSAAEAVRALQSAEWAERGFFAVAAGAGVVLVLLAVLAGRAGVDGVQALVTGAHGTVAIRECTISDATKDPQFWTSGWDCSGTFTDRSGRWHIDQVKIFLHADRRPGPTVSGRVSGPGATWAWPDNGIEWVFALALAAGLPVPAWWSLRAAIEVVEPIRGWPRKQKPTSADAADQRPPQMGNRARRRRRRRR